MTKSRGNQKIKIEVIEAVLELLDKLEPKPKPKPHQDEKLLNLRHKIKRVLRLGYSYAEVTEVLKQQGIDISTERLKRYLSDTDNE